MPRIVFIILFVFYGCLSLLAQSIKPSLRIEANDVLIGDQIKTTVSVETSEGENINFPVISEYWKNENIEILNLSNTEKSNSNGGKQILTQTMTLVFWDTGNYVLPALPFVFSDGAENDSIFSEKLTVKVRYPDGITGDSSYLAPIKPILDEKKTFWDYFLDYSYLIYTILGILLIVAIVYFILERVKKQKAQNALLSPEDRALQALNKLLEAEYSKRGQHALYHEGISFILRTYLNEKFGIKALESITAEILQDVAGIQMNEQLKLELKELLETADLVKFAKASPLPAADNFAAEYIRRLIESVLEAEKALKENK